MSGSPLRGSFITFILRLKAQSRLILFINIYKIRLDIMALKKKIGLDELLDLLLVGIGAYLLQDSWQQNYSSGNNKISENYNLVARYRLSMLTVCVIFD